jgi:hypothetical protein
MGAGSVCRQVAQSLQHCASLQSASFGGEPGCRSSSQVPLKLIRHLFQATISGTTMQKPSDRPLSAVLGCNTSVSPVKRVGSFGAAAVLIQPPTWADNQIGDRGGAALARIAPAWKELRSLDLGGKSRWHVSSRDLCSRSFYFLDHPYGRESTVRLRRGPSEECTAGCGCYCRRGNRNTGNPSLSKSRPLVVYQTNLTLPLLGGTLDTLQSLPLQGVKDGEVNWDALFLQSDAGEAR